MVNETMPGLLGQRYRLLNMLGEGGMGRVYRAIDRLNGQVIALKRVLVPTEKLDFATRSGTRLDSRFALAQEFQLLTVLRHPGIIGVLDYGFDNKQQPFLTMELIENAQTIREAALDRSLVIQVELLIQLLQALSYLHRRGVMHRDLKPSNVLVKNGLVRVLDFGISTLKGQHSTVSGTLAYMAPEILRGETSNIAADLYAVGVIAYELLTGRPLFKSQTPSNLIKEILGTPLDVLLSGLDNQSVKVLEKFLASDPSDRYVSAVEAIASLSEIIHQPVIVESGTFRESFLQTTQLVGRNAEIRLLSDGLMETMSGLGGTWLVGGESGIGKTRLLEELRTMALVNGALVLRGNALSGGSQAYEVWREPLRRLSLSVDLDDVEASIIKTVVPDISVLLDRTIPDAAEFDSEATQARLLSTIANVFKRQEQPTVILLENLHWADEASLKVLAWLIQIIRWLPIMIVASFRDDEQPQLATQFPTMQLIKLGRLPKEAIAEFSESMLGMIANQSQFVEMLQRETEGNPFFLVEVIRALAEEAGQLDRISGMKLPDQVFTGGVRRIIERRLSRISSGNRTLLEVAAVSGSWLDTDVLRAAAPTMNIEEWLTNCASAAVIVLQDGRWHFAHEKLRQAILIDLEPDQVRTLHQQVAQAIEQAHPNSPSQNANLANHWGNAQDTEKESYYSTRAGEQALRSGAYQSAIPYLQRALSIEVQARLAASKQNGNRLRQAYLGRQLAEAFYGAGDLDKARKQQEQALKLLGFPTPSGRIPVISQIVQAWLKHRVQTVFPPHTDRTYERQRDTRIEAMYGQQQLTRIYYANGEVLPLIAANLQGLNLAGSVGVITPAVQAQADANMGISCGLLGMHQRAQVFNQSAHNLVPSIKDLNTVAWVLQLTGTYSIGIGQWATAQEYLSKAVEIADGIEHRRRWQESSSLLAATLSYQGDFARAAQLRSVLSMAARRESTPLTRAWTLLFETEGALLRGQVNDAVTLLDEVMEIVDESNQLLRVRALAYLALANLYMEDHDSAQQLADQAVVLIDRPMMLVYQLPAYVALGLVYLRLWEDAGQTSGAQKFQATTQTVLNLLRRTMRAFPIIQSDFLRIQGQVEWLTGEHRQAQSTLTKSLSVAESLGMPYEQAMAHYQIARLSESGDPSRQQHKERAAEIFKQLGALYYFARTQSL